MSIYDFAQDVRGNGRQGRLLVDEDFNWLEVPHRRRQTASAGTRRAASVSARRAAGTGAHGTALAEHPAPSPPPLQLEPVAEARRELHRRPHSNALSQSDTLSQLDAPPHAEGLYLDERSGGIAVPAEGRRTIVITGHGAERHLPVPTRRQSSLPIYERSGFKPDRIALWAFLLGLALLLGATTSSHAAVLVQHLAR